MKKLLKLLEKDAHLSAEELAKWCAMSKTGFFRLFSRLTGETPNAYLHKCRIRAALRYIDKGYKITAIFGLCGYNDFATFYRNFKKIMGCSPEAYKQSRKSESAIVSLK